MTTTACPSARFARDADPMLVDGLAALWAREPAVAPKVERALAAGNDSLTVAPARSGVPTASAKLPGGRVLQLHSRYDPAGEAEKLVDRLGGTDGLAYFVLGLGLAYHVEALLRRIPSTARVWIIESDAGVIAAAMTHRPMADLLGNPRVGLILEIDRPTLFPKFQPLAALLGAGIKVLEHAPSVERSPAFFAAARQWIEETESFARTALNTLVLNATKTVTNIARNLPWYATSPGIGRLHNAYRGRPAIIVSAGPSLRKNRHLLRQAKGHAVIIAVQTTLKPMLELGIEPDFVTSLDYSEISARFFHDLPRDLKTELVAEAKATDAIFGLHPGPVTLVGSEVADDLLHGVGLPQRPRLKSGATVAHLSFYLAEFLGCDPIVFVGQDLGFSDGLCYAPGTSYDDVWRPELGRFQTVEMKQWEQIARERSILRQIPDHLGRPMYTEQRLFSYLQQFERDFAQTKARVIDASEGGAKKRGATVMTLQEALARYCAEPLPPAAPRADVASASPSVVLDALTKRGEESAQIRSIAERVVPLLTEVRDHIADGARVNRVIARIDPLRQEMNALGRTFQLIMQLSQRHEFERFKTDMAIDGDEAADAVERNRRRATRDLDNARGIVAATRAFDAMLKDAAARVETFAAARQRAA